MSGGSLALALPTLTPPPTGILSPVGGGVLVRDISSEQSFFLIFQVIKLHTVTESTKAFDGW